jgi:glycosyltransferase involved in cell wall biosynthesis
MNQTYSIIIPIHGTEGRLESLLNLLYSIYDGFIEHTIYPNEVLIINNGGVDITKQKEILYRITEGKYQVSIIDVKEPGLNNARNIGLKNATGDIVFFFDDDVIVHRESIKLILTHFLNKSVNLVGGKINLIFDRPTPEWLKSEFFLRFLAPQRFPDAFNKVSKPYFIFGGCMSVRRTVSINKFDLGLDRNRKKLLSGGDTDIALSLENSSFIEPKAEFSTVVRSDRLSIFYFIKRFYWQGMTDAILYYKHNKVHLYDHDELFLTKAFLKTIYTYTNNREGFKLICLFSRFLGFWIRSAILLINIQINEKHNQ